MNKKVSLLIGIFLLVIAVCFMGYVFHHPEAAFPWSNRVLLSEGLLLLGELMYALKIFFFG